MTAGQQPDMGNGGIPLPGFVSRRDDGLYVDVSMVESAENFQQFVERVFSSDALFADLDYRLFLKLLYEPDAPELQASIDIGKKQYAVRLARDIAPFKPERREIYRDPKVDKGGGLAEYFFEPVTLELSIEEPVLGPPEDGVDDALRPILGHKTLKKSVPVKPDPDELIAAMWLKGIRYGLDMPKVRTAINNNSTERVAIARMSQPVAGVDASIIELSNTMHRNDTPKRLPDGRVDLSSFSNHFPQVAADARLLKKIPRVLGKSGWNVRGTVTEPEIPKDLDMEAMAGPGTRFERVAQEEFIVASISGFLHIDAQSHLISVTEKIVSKQGVNMHTTGNLDLAGADFEEHGEVQEKRQVTGHNMTFLANVFGQVVSDGGKIELKKNLAGGEARNPKGSIVIEGTVSNATIEAKDGEIALNIANNSLIVGKKVKIQQAVNCDILAEEVEVETCKGCAIAGKVISIHGADAWKGTETHVSIHLPDKTAWNLRGADLDKQVTAIRQTMAGKQGNLEQISNQAEVRKFLALRQKIEANEINIAPAQEAGWKTTLLRFAPVLRQLDKLADEIRKLRDEDQYLCNQLQKLQAAQARAEAAVSCVIQNVSGETVVRTRIGPVEGLLFDDLPPKELHLRLRDSGEAGEQQFSGDSGAYAWVPPPPRD